MTPLRAEQREALISKAVDRVFYLLKNHDRTMRAELHALQQMVGLFVQAFYNHTPEIDEEHEEAAYASGAARFERFFQTLEEALKQGQSVFHMEVAPEPVWPRPRSHPAPHRRSDWIICMTAIGCRFPHKPAGSPICSPPTPVHG